jgi:hypothetical protein
MRRRLGRQPLSPAFYVIFAAVLTLVTVLNMRETAGSRLLKTSSARG